MLPQVRSVAVSVRDERGDDLACFDVDPVVRERDTGGLVAFDHRDLVR